MLYQGLKSVSLLIIYTNYLIKEQTNKKNQLAYFIPVYKMKYSFLIKIGAEK